MTDGNLPGPAPPATPSPAFRSMTVPTRLATVTGLGRIAEGSRPSPNESLPRRRRGSLAADLGKRRDGWSVRWRRTSSARRLCRLPRSRCRPLTDRPRFRLTAPRTTAGTSPRLTSWCHRIRRPQVRSYRDRRRRRPSIPGGAQRAQAVPCSDPMSVELSTPFPERPVPLAFGTGFGSVLPLRRRTGAPTTPEPCNAIIGTPLLPAGGRAPGFRHRTSRRHGYGHGRPPRAPATTSVTMSVGVARRRDSPDAAFAPRQSHRRAFRERTERRRRDDDPGGRAQSESGTRAEPERLPAGRGPGERKLGGLRGRRELDATGPGLCRQRRRQSSRPRRCSSRPRCCRSTASAVPQKMGAQGGQRLTTTEYPVLPTSLRGLLERHPGQRTP